MSKYIIDVEDNTIKSCKIYEPRKFEEEKIRADEKERIIKELEKLSDNYFQKVALDMIDKAIEIVKGGENEND